MLNVKAKISLISIAVLAAVFSTAASAKTYQVDVKLIEIHAKKPVRPKGDKIYFSITVYPSNKEPYLLRVPMYPEHWLSKELSELHDVILWEGKIAPEDSVDLILSLMKQDLPLLDPDDHLGSAKVKIINHDDKISASWGQPHFVDQPKVVETGSAPDYVMFGHNGEYALRFKLDIVD